MAVSKKSVNKQLKRLGFNHVGWGRGEVSELHNILLPDEEILEVVNGFYEGGFALLVATDVRVLLIDKKPMNYLTVEDLRFDMINEMDYSHRLFGANISIATGNKTLKFTSLNQPRLRKLIGHVQHSMAEIKRRQSTHQEGQNQHLERLNHQLGAYLMAQQQYQLQMQKLNQAQAAGQTVPAPEPPKPSPELSDYLFAQSLLSQHQTETGRTDLPLEPSVVEQISAVQPVQPPTQPAQPANATPIDELRAEGIQEVFGKHVIPYPEPVAGANQITQTVVPPVQQHHRPLEVNPLTIAYSKLPMALRNRKFGRPSLQAHSDSGLSAQSPEAQPTY